MWPDSFLGEDTQPSERRLTVTPKAYEVESERTKPYCGKAESDEKDLLSETSKVTESNHIGRNWSIKCVSQRGWLHREERRLVRNSESASVKIDTGVDLNLITKKTWLTMKDKPRLERTCVSLKSAGEQLKACGQFLAT